MNSIKSVDDHKEREGEPYVNFLEILRSSHLMTMKIGISKQKVKEKCEDPHDNRAKVFTDCYGTEGQKYRNTTDGAKNSDQFCVPSSTASESSHSRPL